MPHVTAFILPNGRACDMAVYANAWRMLRTIPGDSMIRGWGDFPERAEDVLRDMRRGLADRISHVIPGYGKGRKWGYEWQTGMARDCRKVREITGSRVRHYKFETCEARERFGHLLAERED